MVENALGQTSIDVEPGRRDVVGFAGEQKQNRVRDIGGLSDPAVWCHRLAPALDFRVLEIGGQRRFGVAGTNGIDANAVRCPLDGKVLRQHDDARLHRAVSA